METIPCPIYDNPDFFAAYKALRQGDTGLNGALEVPALRALLPDLRGRAIIDLGCGFGDFARWACREGATSVIAVDSSERMIAEARILTEDDRIDYRHVDMERFDASVASVDLVVSSLAFHYVADYPGLVAAVHRWLRPGGAFAFSVEHPMCTASPAGWTRDSAGQMLSWPVDRYQVEGPRRTRWLVDGVTKHHRTVETYVNTLLVAGFVLQALCEPRPTGMALAARPDLVDHLRRPPVLLLAAPKRAAPERSTPADGRTFSMTEDGRE